MTLSEVASTAVAMLGVGSPLLAQTSANLRYQELATGMNMLHLRDLYSLIVPGYINTGTVTATKNSNIVTGNTAAQDVWTPEIIGRFIQFKNVFYEVADLRTDKTIVLTMNYIEETLASGAYKIIQRRVKLDKQVAQIGSFVNMNLGRSIQTLPIDYANTVSPARTSFSSGPLIAMQVGFDKDQSLIYEFYPYSNRDTAILYTGYKSPENLEPNQQLPKAVPSFVLIEGIKIDLMLAEMTKALEAKNVNEAAVWRNDYRAQETKWNNRSKKSAFRNDVGSEDSTFILQTTFGRSSPNNDFDSITTARDQVFSNAP